jgi:DNA-3-methyladenine glycosylase
MKLPKSFYQRDDTLAIAKELIGKLLITNIAGELTGGLIIETEAYMGPIDRGSHAFNNKRTPRNDTMYSEGGQVYMYICYGIHDMLNIVTGKEGSPHAILIRAIQPTIGWDIIKRRRNLYNQDYRLCQGPGSLAKSLALTKVHNGLDLNGDIIWVEDTHSAYPDKDIIAAARVGMNFEGPYKNIPWRFLVKNNKYVSRPNFGISKS